MTFVQQDEVDSDRNDVRNVHRQLSHKPLTNRFAAATTARSRLDHSRLRSTRPFATKFAYLNPVDNSVWSILRVYQHGINDLDDLKHRLCADWSNLNHAVIAAAIRQ